MSRSYDMSHPCRVSMLVTGDSLAVGVAPHVSRAVVDARVGRTSREGVRVIERHGERTLLVSLGANDDPRTWRSFRAVVRRSLVGRDCVAWIVPPRHPSFAAVLRSVARGDARLHVVGLDGIRLVDGVHPGPAGYRLLARRSTRACTRT